MFKTQSILFFCLGSFALAESPVVESSNGPQVVYDQASPDIFPESWRTPRINAKAALLEEAETERCLSIVDKALKKYPAEMLNETLKKVYCLGGLEFSGAVTGGTRSRSAIYVVCKPRYASTDVERIFHAEYSSVLFHKFPQHFDAEAWKAINPEDFVYLGGGVQAVKAGQASRRTDEAMREQGFIQEYAKASIEEDFNSHVAPLFVGDGRYWEAVEKHPKLKAKSDLVMRFYASVHPGFTREYFQAQQADGAKATKVIDTEVPSDSSREISGHLTVLGAKASKRPNPVPPHYVYGAERDWQKQPFRVATLLIEFTDVKHEAVHSRAFYEKMLFSRDKYHRQPDGLPSFGSLADWYRVQSSGRFVLTGQVFDWLTVGETFEAIRALEFKDAKERLFQTALDLLREREGKKALHGFDAFAFIHAGPITGPSGNILWSHKHHIEDKPYFTTGEIERIGVFCHEWGHMLGMPDLYAKKGVRESFGPWCAMADGYRGIYPRSFCVWTKTRLGWCHPTVVDATTPQKLVLRPIQDHPNDAIIIPLNGLDGVGAEFLMLENRSTAGNDAEGQAGLFIWRVKRLLTSSDIPRYELKLPGPTDVPGIDPGKRWVAWPNGAKRDYIVPAEGKNLPVALRNIRLEKGIIYFDLRPH